jgi:hypothetical protein
MFDVKVEFICNSYARINNKNPFRRDVYKRCFENDEDATAFILAAKCTIVDKDTIAKI